jgi:hypothetical protein
MRGRDKFELRSVGAAMESDEHEARFLSSRESMGWPPARVTSLGTAVHDKEDVPVVEQWAWA